MSFISHQDMYKKCGDGDKIIKGTLESLGIRSQGGVAKMNNNKKL